MSEKAPGAPKAEKIPQLIAATEKILRSIRNRWEDRTFNDVHIERNEARLSEMWLSELNSQLEKVDKKRPATPPKDFERLRELVRKEIVWYLKADLQKIRPILSSSREDGVGRFSHFEKHLLFVEADTNSPQVRKDVIKPSPFRLTDEERRDISMECDAILEVLYGACDGSVSSQAQEIINKAPENFDSPRFAYLVSRAQNVCKGVGFLGFQQFDELQKMVAQIESVDAVLLEALSIKELLQKLPASEMRNFFKEGSMLAAYWKDRTYSQHPDALPYTPEEKKRQVDRRFFGAIRMRLLEWKKREMLTQEEGDAFDDMYRQYDADMGTATAKRVTS